MLFGSLSLIGAGLMSSASPKIIQKTVPLRVAEFWDNRFFDWRGTKHSKSWRICEYFNKAKRKRCVPKSGSSLNALAKPTVLDVDPSEFLREGALTMMPHYAKAERDISAHFCDLPDDAMQAVMEYYIYLETCGTKLAHFKAFILGDELLLYTEPGYAPDRVLSYNYRRMLSEWFGVEESAL